MLMIILAFVMFVAAMIRPFTLVYFMATFLTFRSLAPSSVISELKFTLGGINVFPLDFVFGITVLLILLAPIRASRPAGMRMSGETRVALFLIVLYLMFQAGQSLAGLFGGIPKDSLIRMTALNMQVLYLFLPLLFGESEKQFKRLLLYVIVLTLVFPIGQLFLVGSDDTARLLKEQGTFRLGFGDFNVILAISLLAFLTWERRVWLAGFPAIGILLLAHRSAYIAVVISAFITAVVKGRQLKTVFLLGIIGMVLVSLMMVFSSLSSNQVIEGSANRLSETFKATGTTEGRLHAIELTFKELANHPLTGMGYVRADQLRRQTSQSAYAFNLLHPHNFVLSSLTKDGLIGTFLLLMLMTHLLLSARRLGGIQGYQQVGAMLSGCMVFFIIYATMNTTLGSAGYVMWILAGTTLWFMDRARTEVSKS